MIVRCNCCNREWACHTEQAISIELHKECIVCKFTPSGNGSNNGTKEELDHISSEAKKRCLES